MSKRGTIHRTLEQRFWEKVDTSGGPDACWPWTASLNNTGYGQIYVNALGRATPASRVSFFLTHGRWPECALHVCDNRPCCNPAHLFEGNRADNTNDMITKGREASGPVQSAVVKNAWKTRDGVGTRLTDEQWQDAASLIELGWSKTDVAKAYNVSPRTVYRWL